MRLIEIVYDATTGTLALADEANQSDVSLGPREDVAWQFVGLPNTWIPSVHFLDGDDAGSILGPFASLRQTQQQVIASGRVATDQEVYVATIRPAGSDPSSDDPSFEARLTADASDGPSTAPTVFVTPGEEAGTLSIEPAYFTIVTGDTVEWVFEGFAEPSWYPVVSFDGGPPGSAVWPYGPFTSLCTGDKTIVGAGNNGIQGDYTYTAQVLDTRTSTPFRALKVDPGMGNNGDPPGGGG